jgi:hypothetical protein
LTAKEFLEMTRIATIVGTVVVLVAAILVFVSSPQAALAVDPVFVSGNATCSQVIPGTIELKVEPVISGIYTDGFLVVEIVVTGSTFDWEANMGIDGVVVKGGPNANLYLYNPEAYSDDDLHAPNKNNGGYYGLSHLSFCYDIDPPTNTPTFTPTYTPTNTPTNTPTFTPTNTPTYTPTNTPTNTPTFTPTNTPTNTPTFTPTNTPTYTPTNTPTNTPTFTPTNTPTYTPTNTPTNTPTFTPTTPPSDWCSPGFWKNHLGLWPIGPYTPYNSVFDPDLAGNPSLYTVISQPQKYGGGLTEQVADYLSTLHGEVNFTGERGECPLG